MTQQTPVSVGATAGPAEPWPGREAQNVIHPSTPNHIVKLLKQSQFNKYCLMINLVGISECEWNFR